MNNGIETRNTINHPRTEREIPTEAPKPLKFHSKPQQTVTSQEPHVKPPQLTEAPRVPP